MKYQQLGRTDIKVSNIALGTMTWGEQNTEAQAHAQLDMAIAAGVNLRSRDVPGATQTRNPGPDRTLSW